ncbi:EfeO-type cupredoxin-like domain-containing protein [Paraburkholderia sacchari]|uniref:cupredoxin domain-containing protein n=1 Tax=Paraburkholderia sacchari TaxID=159450 RepID=UPI0039A725E7
MNRLPTVRRLVRVARAGACGMCALALMAFAGPAAAGDHVVTIAQMRFSPPVVKVHRGERIVWVNQDLVEHTVSARTKTFDSGSIAPGASWRYVASTPGSYSYQCLFHPAMRGTLIVEPKP